MPSTSPSSVSAGFSGAAWATIKSPFLSAAAHVLLAFYTALFAFVALSHVRYPGFTETMEGDVLQSIERVSSGLVPYPAPSGEFIALCYMPLYYYACAPLYLLLGDSLTGPRIVSTLSAIASALLVAVIAFRESRSRPVACLAAALFFASYRIMDSYLTCALPDSLLLFWILLGFVFLAYGTTWYHDLLWLLFFSLSFWTKQHGAFFFGFAVLYALLFRKNALPRWALVLGILVGGPLSYLAASATGILGERFSFFTITVPGNWEHKLWYSLRRTAYVLTCLVPIPALLTALYLKRSTTLRPLRTSPLSWMTVTGLLSTMLTMTAAGSSNNHYVPFLALLCATTALGFAVALEQGIGWVLLVGLGLVTLLSAGITTVIGSSTPSHRLSLETPLVLAACTLLVLLVRRLPRIIPKPLTVTAALLLLAHCALATYYPPAHAAHPEAVQAASLLRTELAALKGPVFWIPYGNIPADLTGPKLPRAPSWVALQDIERQLSPAPDAALDLQPFLERMRHIPTYHVLSNEPIAGVPVWQQLAPSLRLVRDYKDSLAGLSQAASHWFSWRSFPRYLYVCEGYRD